ALENVGTAFPEIGPVTFRDLSGRMEAMSEKDLESDAYILYSNVMNDFSDAEIDELRQNWQMEHRLEKASIEVILYRR
ncbi:MAG: hypothetical protein R3350_05100, partial [Saprospiraceae bacterium]|nr:hypothetical protein [Saprospiraceae bacterium]